MSALPDIARWCLAQWISPSEVRSETWALGCRHQGDALAGARAELSSSGLTARRKVLLRAVIRDLGVVQDRIGTRNRPALASQIAARPGS